MDILDTVVGFLSGVANGFGLVIGVVLSLAGAVLGALIGILLFVFFIAIFLGLIYIIIRLIDFIVRRPTPIRKQILEAKKGEEKRRGVDLLSASSSPPRSKLISHPKLKGVSKKKPAEKKAPAKKHGLVTGNYTPFEDEVILNYHSKLTAEEIAKKIHRKTESVEHRIGWLIGHGLLRQKKKR